MKLNSLKIKNFRNYSSAVFEFNPGLNIIYGNNGVGKTNIVEAIYALSLTKSFRTNNDKYLIKNGEVCAKIEGEIEKDTLNTYQVVINKDGKKVMINDDIQSKISDYISNINVILLEPDEQTVFNSSPADRRKLLNVEISQMNKNYVLLLNSYNKIIKQRNFYLREMYLNGNASFEYLDILTKKLIEYGKEIFKIRKSYIDNINKYISDKYAEIFENGLLQIKYISNYKNDDSESILAEYKKNYNREINFGKTLIGIHHDDIIFYLDEKNIAEYGSNGQKKNAILAFKLSEIEVIREKNGDLPILILDDIFSALDSCKIKNIIKKLDNSIQTFITTTELRKISKKLLINAKLYKVDKGTIEEVIYGK